MDCSRPLLDLELIQQLAGSCSVVVSHLLVRMCGPLEGPSVRHGLPHRTRELFNDVHFVSPLLRIKFQAIEYSQLNATSHLAQLAPGLGVKSPASNFRSISWNRAEIFSRVQSVRSYGYVGLPVFAMKYTPRVISTPYSSFRASAYTAS
ncbi:hypothetical protein CASbig_23 [Mycobacterium phage CASbig]|uniref:hypothetical protein n=1 Tax=Mycobacterium phage CASbig TaxID=1327035 RepID=UPI00032B6303|nr:hypothetical protein JMN56_gp23 [Mycobacterium phage CASbig]AGK88074.1 hypothetical protein CASbig_23 [Mycobacterium phage CASbig]